MAVFPSINPVYGASKNNQFKRQSLPIGDGYISSFSFGLNSVQSEWSLEWRLDEEQAIIVESFLQARADEAAWFEWAPPDSSILQRFRCDEWNIELAQYNLYIIKAVFRRVFELVLPELSAAPATCVDMPGDNCLDLLCEDITGPAITGNAVVGATLTYSTFCAGGYVEWRIVDNLTNTYTVAAGGVGVTTYVATAASALSGKSVIAVTKCPDPTEQDGYGCEVASPPLTIFNPYAYQYARAKFRRYYPLNPNSNPNEPFSNSPWINLSSYQYFIGEGNPYSNSSMSARQAAPWLINFSVYSATVNGGGFTSAFGYLQNNGTYFGQFTTNESWTNLPIGTLVTQISGYFEFSSNASTVLATWNGV